LNNEDIRDYFLLYNRLILKQPGICFRKMVLNDDPSTSSFTLRRSRFYRGISDTYHPSIAAKLLAKDMN
jgi:hypothetical protein